MSQRKTHFFTEVICILDLEIKLWEFVPVSRCLRGGPYREYYNILSKLLWDGSIWPDWPCQGREPYCRLNEDGRKHFLRQKFISEWAGSR